MLSKRVWAVMSSKNWDRIVNSGVNKHAVGIDSGSLEAFTYETTHTPQINAIIKFIPKDDFRGTIGEGSMQGVRRLVA